MKKVVSFCLWGDNPKYTIGAIRNAELAKEYYPDWECRFYMANTVPQDIVDKLNTFDNVELVMMETDVSWDGMFWRFYPITDSDVEVMISRDTDCRITDREARAVNEWLESGKTLHVMRDHPMHTEPIMGGMWGCRCKEMFAKIIENIYDPYPNLKKPEHLKEVVEAWLAVEKLKTEQGERKSIPESVYHNHGIDQRFTRGVMYNLSWNDAHITDSFPMYNAWSGTFDGERAINNEVNTGFSVPRKDWYDFVGQIYFEDDTANEESAWFLKQRDTCIYMDTPDMETRDSSHYSIEEGQNAEYGSNYGE